MDVTIQHWLLRCGAPAADVGLEQLDAHVKRLEDKRDDDDEPGNGGAVPGREAERLVDALCSMTIATHRIHVEMWTIAM